MTIDLEAITPEAIEAAAQAISGYSDGQWPRWCDTVQGQRYQLDAQLALAAAAPLLRAPLVAEVVRLRAWNGQAQIELDADHAEIGRLTAERDQWRRVAEYGWHLHNYGENAPGGTETWREFEQLIRAAADQGQPA